MQCYWTSGVVFVYLCYFWDVIERYQSPDVVCSPVSLTKHSLGLTVYLNLPKGSKLTSLRTLRGNLRRHVHLFKTNSQGNLPHDMVISSPDNHMILTILYISNYGKATTGCLNLDREYTALIGVLRALLQRRQRRRYPISI